MNRAGLPLRVRRQLLGTGLGLGTGLLLPDTAAALPATPLRFPRDHGSHPDFRTEWWYLTGRLMARAPAREYGFQLTFFRTRVAAAQSVQSAFAARQLLAAHAAVTDLASRRLLHDQRLARSGFGVAQADEDDTRIRLRDWSLVRRNGAYQARARGPELDFSLDLLETQPRLLQGQDGLSRKGPEARQASYYYSLPQLQVQGELRLQGRPLAVQGRAWLDHEWSQELLHPQAVGWDWIGMNLHDGSALTAFQLRDRQADSLWEGGSYRHPAMGPGARPYVFAPGEVEFHAARHWVSPLTGARYPVEWRIRTPADVYTVRARLDNQELDSRASTGTVYWEGLSELLDSQGRPVGQGYLEMTGYASPLRL